jgi:hypothetical protein
MVVDGSVRIRLLGGDDERLALVSDEAMRGAQGSCPTTAVPSKLV